MQQAGHQTEMKLWEENRKKHDLKYPDEYVLRYLHKNFPTGEGRRILDFGCGSGRNTVAMAEMGFEIVALDYNLACLSLTKEKMEQKNYKKIQYIQNTRTDIPVSSCYFDCIVAWGSLFYLNQEERNQMFLELHRVLKEDGILLADFRTKEDFMYKKGREIEKDLFILDENAKELSGINYWFCSREEITDLFLQHRFQVANIEKMDFYVGHMSRKNSHYHIWARKGVAAHE